MRRVKIINEEMNKVFTNAETKWVKWVGQKWKRECVCVCVCKRKGKNKEKIIAIWYLGQYILLDLEVKRCAWVLISLSLSLTDKHTPLSLSPTLSHTHTRTH